MDGRSTTTSLADAEQHDNEICFYIWVVKTCSWMWRMDGAPTSMLIVIATTKHGLYLWLQHKQWLLLHLVWWRAYLAMLTFKTLAHHNTHIKLLLIITVAHHNTHIKLLLTITVAHHNSAHPNTTAEFLFAPLSLFSSYLLWQKLLVSSALDPRGWRRGPEG